MKQSLDHISAIRQLWNEGHSPSEIKRILISRRYFRKSRYRGEKTSEAILSFIQQRCREFQVSREARETARDKLPLGSRHSYPQGLASCEDLPANKESGLSGDPNRVENSKPTQCERVESEDIRSDRTEQNKVNMALARYRRQEREIKSLPIATPTLDRKPPRKSSDDLVERLMRLPEMPRKAAQK